LIGHEEIALMMRREGSFTVDEEYIDMLAFNVSVIHYGAIKFEGIGRSLRPHEGTELDWAVFRGLIDGHG
jgi:hypothetical protein